MIAWLVADIDLWIPTLPAKRQEVATSTCEESTDQKQEATTNRSKKHQKRSAQAVNTQQKMQTRNREQNTTNELQEDKEMKDTCLFAMRLSLVM